MQKCVADLTRKALPGVVRFTAPRVAHTLKSLWSIGVKITGCRMKFYGAYVCVRNAEEWGEPDLIGIAMDIAYF